jgi:phytoene synthase
MAHDAVMAAARAGEPDRFVAALLAPSEVRDDLLALAAFCAELRRIPDAVAEPMMGEVRLQWWRDAMAAAPAPTGHPIADAWIAAIARHGLPTDTLNALTEARAFDLYDDPMADRMAFEAYLDRTEGFAFDLAVRMLTGRPATHDHRVAASQGFGLVRLLAELPRRRNALPFDLTTRGDGSLTDDGRDLFDRLVQQARDAHATLRRSAGRMDRSLRAAFLPTAIVPTYLRHIQRRDREPLRDPIHMDPTLRMVRLAWARFRGL